MSRSNHQILPILSLLLTASLWGLVWYPLRLLEDQGLSGLWLSLTSYGAVLAVGLVWLAVVHQPEMFQAQLCTFVGIVMWPYQPGASCGSHSAGM